MLARNVLVTGCNRGIGLELIKQLAGSKIPPVNIFACCRNPNEAQKLQDIAATNSSIKILQLDVTDESRYAGVKKEVEEVVGEDGLNLLINNAGYAPKNMRNNPVTWAQMEDTLRVNTIAPMMLTQTLIPLLRTAAKSQEGSELGVKRAAIVHMSSKLGSIASNNTGMVAGSLYPYRCSKAALNAITKSMSLDLKSDNILVTSLDPGWVKTDMGTKDATITVEESVSKIIQTLGDISNEHTGQFIQHDLGLGLLPW